VTDVCHESGKSSVTLNIVEDDLFVLAKTIDPAVLGRRIREARLAAGIRQADVADAHCSTGYLSRIEAGQRRPDPSLLEQLAQSLGVTVHSLLHAASEDHARLRLELDYAELYLSSGEPTEAVRRAEAVVDALTANSNAQLLIGAKRVLASAQEALGRTEDAIETFTALAEESPGDPAWLQVMLALCRCYREVGDLSRAVAVGESAMNRATELGLDGTTETVQVILTLAAAHYENGDITDAVRLCQRAMKQAETADSPSARASAYWNASVIESHRGDVFAAITLAKKALALFEVESEARHLARLRSQLGIFQLRLDPPEVDDAEHNLQQAALEMSAANTTPADRARNDLALAQAHMLLGDLPAAQSEADTVFQSTRDEYPLIAAEARMLAGSVFAMEGDLEQAKAAARESALLLSSIDAEQALGQLWFDLADMLESLGAHDESRDAYRRAGISLGLWRRLGGAPSQVRAK
jgi:transcriptional regulator with XRE-family HTH domain